MHQLLLGIAGEGQTTTAALPSRDSIVKSQAPNEHTKYQKQIWATSSHPEAPPYHTLGRPHSFHLQVILVYPTTVGFPVVLTLDAWILPVQLPWNRKRAIGEWYPSYPVRLLYKSFSVCISSSLTPASILARYASTFPNKARLPCLSD